MLQHVQKHLKWLNMKRPLDLLANQSAVEKYETEQLKLLGITKDF